MLKPIIKPESPFFSSGPCKKRPGWNAATLNIEMLGRSHRSKPAKERLLEVIIQSKKILNLPYDYKVGIWTYYFQNGERRLEGEYILGQKDGLWTYWYDNDIIASKYFYQSKTIDGERMEWHIDKECWTRSAMPCECGPNWWSECENR